MLRKANNQFNICFNAIFSIKDGKCALVSVIFYKCVIIFTQDKKDEVLALQ